MRFHVNMKKTIHKAQHCQRNWDLTKEIPKEDMQLFAEAVTQCPSKQNIAFYKAHFITNREVIEKVHAKTDGAIINFNPRTSVTNSQVLANLLVVFEEIDVRTTTEEDRDRNVEVHDLVKSGGSPSPYTSMVLERDKQVAVGVAAGFLNVIATWMGYSTGCCNCFDENGVMEVLGLKKKPLLMMGIGFKDETRSRRIHHKDPNIIFPTKAKQPIEVNVIT